MSCENNSAADTNASSLAVTKDDMPATAATAWTYMEPNDISSYAASIEKVARDPISLDRQRRKGSITSVAAAPQFTSDLTLEMIEYFAPGFLFSNWKGLQTGSYSVVDVDSGTSTFNVAAGAALTAGMLVYADGFLNPENNGLKTVASGTATTIVVNETLVDETAGDAARLYLVGIRGSEGSVYMSSTGDLESAAIDFTTLGLTVGQYIHIGGADEITRFDSGSNGKARIASISTGILELEARDTDFVGDLGTGKTIDILFGSFVRNVPVGDVDFNKQWYHMEMTYNTDPMLYEYAECCLNNTLAINNALQDKATLDLAFVGKDVETPTETPRLGVRKNQVEVEPFNTSSDIMRLRVSDLDDEGVTTFFKDTNITINNNVAAEYVLGQLAAEFMNFGNFEVDIDTSVVFTDAMILNAIRNNETLGIDMSYRNGDGGFVLSLPSGTFGDGSKSFPRNQKVTIATPFVAHRDEDRGYTMGVSLFWYLP